MIEMYNLNPVTKFDDIIAFTKKYDPQIITEKPELIEIKIISVFSEELWIEISTEFSIFFGDWHAHYFGSVEEYDVFITDLLGILENRKFTICAYKNDEWCGSRLSESKTPNEVTIREEYGNDKVIKCNYWDKTKNIIFDVIL